MNSRSKSGPVDGDPAEAPALGQLRRELARGTAELAVLSILAAERCYGYELLKRTQQVGSEWEVKEGTLYPLLHRLEDAGHIAGEWLAEGRGRPRKYYVLTESGRQRAQLLRTEWELLIESVRKLLNELDGGAS